ncbi:MAG: hypothetical protein WCR59_09365 [Planctomycetota bacterium]
MTGILARLDELEARNETDCGGAWRTTGTTGQLPTAPTERAYVIQLLLSCADVEELDGAHGREHRANYWRRLVTLADIQVRHNEHDDAAATLARCIPHLHEQHGISAALLEHI